MFRGRVPGGPGAPRTPGGPHHAGDRAAPRPAGAPSWADAVTADRDHSRVLLRSRRLRAIGARPDEHRRSLPPAVLRGVMGGTLSPGLRTNARRADRATASQPPCSLRRLQSGPARPARRGVARRCRWPRLYHVRLSGCASVLNVTWSKSRVVSGANSRYRYFSVSARKKLGIRSPFVFVVTSSSTV